MNNMIANRKHLFLNKVPLSIILSLISIFGFTIRLVVVNNMGYGWLEDHLFFQAESYSITNFHTILTFPFVESFMNATQNPIIFLLLGMIIERNYTKKTLLLLVLCSIYIIPLTAFFYFFLNIDMIDNVYVPAYFSGIRYGTSAYFGLFFAFYLTKFKCHKIWIHLLFSFFFIGQLVGIIRLFSHVRIDLIFYYFMILISFFWGMRSELPQHNDNQKIVT